eukprot:1155954-Pelagomonas_calceolata.AAC.3
MQRPLHSPALEFDRPKSRATRLISHGVNPSIYHQRHAKNKPESKNHAWSASAGSEHFGNVLTMVNTPCMQL